MSSGTAPTTTSTAHQASQRGEPKLRGRALITGGTSGIGLAFAHELAQRNLDLVLVARDAERLAQTATQLADRYGVAVEQLRADLAQRDQLATVVARLEDSQQPVDVLVNNAGFGLRSRLLAADTTEHEAAIDLMIRAVLVLGAAAGRTMRDRQHGVIINLASVAGLIPMGSYAAIKSWVTSYSESLGLELAGSGVQVTALLPGWVRTEFHDRAKIRTSSIPSVLWLNPQRVVRECLRAVERGRWRCVPSKRFKVLAFLAAHAPRPAVRAVTAKLQRGRHG